MKTEIVCAIDKQRTLVLQTGDHHMKDMGRGERQLLPFVLLFAATVALAHEPETQAPFDRSVRGDAWEAHFHTAWESRYFSEGRDSLDGDSLSVTSFELGYGNLFGGGWYGVSPDQSFDELQLMLGASEELGDLEFSLTYTHLQFPSHDLHDNEVGAGVSWSGLPLALELTGDVYHSFDADGSFFELALNRETELMEGLSLIASGAFGVNQGYVPDGHDGANHLALRIGVQYALTSSLSITTHGTYSWALNRETTLPGDEQLKDFFHTSVGLQWSF